MVGVDISIYDQDSASPTSSLTETKILLNNTFSVEHKGVQFMTLDLTDFPLQHLWKKMITSKSTQQIYTTRHH